MKSNTKELLQFFLIAFGWSWLLNLPQILFEYELINLSPTIGTILGNLSIFGPAISAFFLTWKKSGDLGMKELFKRGWKLDSKKTWLIPTLLLSPIIGLLTVGILNLLGEPISWEAALPLMMIVPIGLIIFIMAYAEEYGWRGYALDRLQKKYNPFAASLILGLLWGLWHLPLHFIDGTTQYVIPISEYIAQTILLTIIYTWLHNGTKGSLLIASLFHTIGNITGATIPFWTSSTGRWVNFTILLIPALLIALFQFSSNRQTSKTHLEK